MKKTFLKLSGSLLLLSLLTLAACKTSTEKPETGNNPEVTEDILCLDSPAELVEIELLPLGDISTKDMENLKNDLLKGLDSLEPQIESHTYIPLIFDINIKPKDNLPDSCYYQPRNRYRAEKLLRFIKKKYGVDKYVIGVTNKDISTSIHDAVDYGIQGLSYMPGKTTIISTYRVKDKKNLWKLAAHEFAHGYFKLPHCSKNNPKCLMKDAEGGNPHLELKETFCEACLKTIKM